MTRWLNRLLLLLTIGLHFHLQMTGPHGVDFFYYWSLARLSREVGGPETYRAKDRLIAIESRALAERMTRESGETVTETWVRSVVPTLPDPRRHKTPLPPQYFPEWSQLNELSLSEHSKVSPATFGTFRLLGLDRLPFRTAFDLWHFFSVAVLLATLALLRRMQSLSFSLFALLALWFGPARSSLVYGQFIELALLGAAGFFALRFRPNPRPFTAGAALALSVALKPLAAGLILYLGWSIVFRRDHRNDARTLAGLATGLTLIAVVFEIALGAGTWRTWFETLPQWYSTYTYHLGSFANRSALGALMVIFNAGPNFRWVTAGHGIYVALTLAAYGWLFLAPRPRSILTAYPEVAASMGILGPLMVSRFVLIQYEVFLLIPFTILLRFAKNRTDHALLLILWFGFGFYDHVDFLLISKPEIFLYPVMLFMHAAVVQAAKKPDTVPA